MTKHSDQPLGFPAKRPIKGRKIPRTAPLEIDKRPPEAMDQAHRQAVAEGRAQVRRGEVATDEEIETAFGRFGT